MKINTLLILIIGLFISQSVFCKNFEQRIIFTSKEKATSLLLCKDTYLNNLSKFDKKAKYHSTDPHEINRFIGSQAKAWSNEEIIRLKEITEEIQSRINHYSYKFNLPENIFFIRSTGLEEGGSAAYTRMNFIVFGDQISDLPDSILTHMVTHELFHIISRHNSDVMTELYNAIGFYKIRTLKLPQSLDSIRISNPDAPDIGWQIKLERNDTSGNYIIFLYAKSEYTSGSFIEYLRLGFLEYNIETEAISKRIYKFDELKGFFEQTGKNTNYILHPEEILADNFAYSLDSSFTAKSPEITKMMQEYFKQ